MTTISEILKNIPEDNKLYSEARLTELAEVYGNDFWGIHEGERYLFAAIYNSDTKLACQLIEALPPKTLNQIRGTLGKTYLHHAVDMCQHDITSALLSMKGVNANILNSQRKTALDIAINRFGNTPKDYSTLGELIEKSNLSTIDRQGNTYLHKITGRADAKKIIPLLIQQGVPVNTCNSEGETAMDLADKEHKDIILGLTGEQATKLTAAISELTIYATTLGKEGRSEKGTTVMNLANTLREEVKMLRTTPTSIKNFKQKLHEQDAVLGEHAGWKRVIANIALCVAGFGVGYLVAGLIHLKTSGHFLFFNDTTSQQKVKNIDHLIQEEIKSPPQPPV